MYQQREPDASSFTISGLWDPDVTGLDEEEIALEPRPADRYVVVDEIVDDVVRLAAAPWPQVDEAGRLRFGETGSEQHAFDRAELQGEVDRRRIEEGQLHRALRIGDVFLVRGFAPRADGWERLVDVTAAGRPAGKRAALRAVAQTTEPTERGLEEADARDLSWRRPPEDRTEQAVAQPSQAIATASVANPAV